MSKLLYYISAGEVSKLKKPVLWSTIVNILNLLPKILLSVIVRNVFSYYSSGKLNTNKLWISWGIMFGLFFVLLIVQHRALIITYRDGYAASANGRIRLAEHIRKLPLGFLSEHDPSELGNMMMVDFDQTERAMTHALPQLVSGFLVSIIAFILMLFMDWQLAMAMFAGFPISMLILLLTKKLQEKVSESQSAARTAQSSKIQEYLSGLQEIKAFNLQGNNFSKLKQTCIQFRDECIKKEGTIAPINLVANAFLRTGLMFITIVGTYLLIRGELDIETFAFFLLVGTRIFDPLSIAIIKISEIKMSSLSGKRIMEILEYPAMQGTEISQREHNIEFSNVTFKYNQGTILDDISFNIKENQLTAIVGPSGSGKSTILRLIARFYDPQSGDVYFGGMNEREMEPEDLMSNIAMVFQDVYLFKDTIRNNIRYGKESASIKEIETAAKMACCYDFIMNLPDGFDTVIGEGGATLSGGEKQRISIARAILKDAPVILLDEATSSLDPENEAEIQRALSRLIKGRTVVTIAHRLKTVVDADQIIVLNNGSVAETGTHQELLSKKGLYYKLWNIQHKMQSWKIKTS